MPAAVVFDLDGVLVDSEHAWAEAERRVVEAFGVRWDPAVHLLLLGLGNEEAVRVLTDFLGIRDERVVARRMLQEAAAQFRGGVAPRDGAVELVAALQPRVPLAVATNARRVLADLSLSSAKLAGAMTAVICAEDVDAAKPAPDPYLAACAALEVEPRRCVAIEDSPVGVTSAKAAGLWVVGCPSVEGVALPQADAVVADLAELDVSGWLR